MVNNEIEILYKEVRRYCIDRSGYWSKELGNLEEKLGPRGAYVPTEEEIRIYPRYLVLHGILMKIEALYPETLNNIDELRTILCNIAFSAESNLRNPTHYLEIMVMNEERDLLYHFINEFKVDTAKPGEPLFYRHFLGEEERTKFWQALVEKWDLREETGEIQIVEKFTNGRGPHIERFDVNWFCHLFKEEKLREIFQQNGITRVFKFGQYSIEKDVSHAFTTDYGDGGEGYYCSTDLEALIYYGPEAIFVGGSWLLPLIKPIMGVFAYPPKKV